jgi:regulator of chromosome condensation (RCC1) repeat-containing protein
LATAPPSIQPPGYLHTCANGTRWCRGLNDFGQLGIGNTIDQDLPHQVAS